MKLRVRKNGQLGGLVQEGHAAARVLRRLAVFVTALLGAVEAGLFGEGFGFVVVAFGRFEIRAHGLDLHALEAGFGVALGAAADGAVGAQVPLAVIAGEISLAAGPFDQGGLAGIEFGEARVPDVAVVVHARAVSQPAGEERRAGRRAEARGGAGGAEAHGVRGELFQVGRFGRPSGEGGHVVLELLHVEQQDVAAAGLSGRGGGEPASEEFAALHGYSMVINSLRNSATASGTTVTPSPGPVGTGMQPSGPGAIFSRMTASRKGLSV